MCLLPTFFEIIFIAGTYQAKLIPYPAIPKDLLAKVQDIHQGCKRNYPDKPNICAVQVRITPKTKHVSVVCD